jgi:DNA-binding IclR family transcriptional regulator
LTLASGQIRAGLVTHTDLEALHEATGLAVFLGALAGEHLIYLAEVGSDPVAGFDARSNIRRSPLATAGGKALLAERPDAEREAYLLRRGADEAELVQRFLEELQEIRKSRIATNTRRAGARFAIATTVHSQAGGAVASITVVGATADVEPRLKKLSTVLLRHVDQGQQRQVTAREAI